jgi:dihydroorotate dehydrogenase
LRLLKITPDLNDSQLDEVIELVKQTKFDGIIATNTSTSREGLKTDSKKLHEIGNGCLSGKPLAKRSTEVIRYLAEKSGKAFPIIAVGGIHSAEDALEKIAAGADLVQVYTGFVYEGPGLVKRILKKL